MKSSFFLFLLVLFSVSCFAQNTPDSTQITIPVEDFETYVEEHGTIPDGANLHDVNNVRANYTGTWSGDFEGKSLTIVVTEGNIDREDGINDDILYLRYELEDSQGNTLISTLDLPNENPLVITGVFFGTTTQENLIYVLTYKGEEADCGQEGDAWLYKKTDDQLVFTIIPYQNIRPSGCDESQGAHVLPTHNEAVYMSKVE